MSNTRIALLGCNSLFREGLRHILEDKKFEVVLSSETSEFSSDIGQENDPHNLIVLVDQSSPEFDPDEMCSIMDRFPGAKLVYLAKKFDLDDMVLAFKSGAQGYIVKDIPCESLIGSLQLIALGEKILPGELIDQLPDGPNANGAAAPAVPNLHEILSAREIKILRHLAAGFPNKTIANRLDLSEGAVKVHVKGVLRKLNVNNRTQAALLAFNSGLEPVLEEQAPDRDGAAVPDDMEGGAILKSNRSAELAIVY